MNILASGLPEIAAFFIGVDAPRSGHADPLVVMGDLNLRALQTDTEARPFPPLNAGLVMKRS